MSILLVCILDQLLEYKTIGFLSLLLLVIIIGLYFHILSNLRQRKQIKMISDARENLLLFKEQRFQSLFETLHDGVLLIKDGEIIDINNTILSLFDTTYASIINRPLYQLSPLYQPNGEFSVDLSRMNMEKLNNHKSFSCEWVFCKSNGEEFISEISLSKFTIRDEIYNTVIIRDITINRKTQTELDTYRTRLENMVLEKTVQLEDINRELISINGELSLNNKKLEMSNFLLLKEMDRHKQTLNQKTLLEEKLNQFISQSSDGISIVNMDGVIEEWNMAMERISGYKKEEINGKYIWDIEYMLLIDKHKSIEKYNEIKKRILEVLSNSDTFPGMFLEGDIQTANREEKYVQTSIFSIVSQNKNYIGRITRDITPMRRMTKKIESYQYELEELLAQKTKNLEHISTRFNEIYNNSPDAIVFVDLFDEGSIQKVFDMNRNAKELFAITEDRIRQGLMLNEIIDHQEYESFKDKILCRVLNGDNVNTEEIGIISKKNKFWQTVFLPLMNNSGECHGFVIYLIDSTVEIERDRVSAILKTAVDSWPIEFWVCNRDGYYIMQNTSFIRKRGSLVGHKISDEILPKKNIEMWEQNDNNNIQDTLFKQRIKEVEDNSNRIYLCILSPIYSQSIHYDGFVGIKIDITDQTKANDMLKIEEHRLSVLLTLNNMDNHTIQELTDYTLKEAVFLTRSNTGFLALINEYETDLTMYSWFSNEGSDNDNIKKSMILSIQTSGLWEEVLKKRIPVIINGLGISAFIDKSDPESYKWINRVMIVPVFQEKRIVAIAGMANKEQNYEEIDIRELTLLMQGMWKQIQRKKDELSLRTSEERFRILNEHAPDAIFLYDYKKDFIIDANKNAELLFGCSREELIKKGFVYFYAQQQPDERPVEDSVYDNIKRAMAGEMLTFERIIRNMNQQLIHCEVRLVKMPSLKGNILRVSYLDITKRKAAEKLILKTVIDTEEKERKKIAGNLHDDIGPQLAGLNMYVSTLSRKLKDTEFESSLKLIQRIIKNSINGLRSVSRNLSPHHLEAYGLAAAINYEIEISKELCIIQFNSNLNKVRFASEIEATYFRVVKELLNNSLKYSGASEINIGLNIQNEKLFLDYSDNGVGFDYNKKKNEGTLGIGLLNIENRINYLNGKCFFFSEPGQGFNLHVETLITT